MTDEQRRQHVLKALEHDRGLRFAWYSDGRPDACGNVLLAVAIRGVGSCELAIDADRYDSFTLLQVLAASGAEPPR
jgi:hypothetical protein